MKVRQCPAVDVLQRDGEYALLLEDNAVRLSQLSFAIYELCATPADVADVAAALHERFGAPAEGSVIEATSAAVRQMIAAGLLEPTP